MNAVAYMGVMVDHLIPDCPHLARSEGTRLWGLVDVDGSDLCGWCVRVWKARNP